MSNLSTDELSKRVRAIRAYFDLSGPAFADMIGLPLPSIRNYEQGKQLPGSDALRAFIAIGIRADWLLTGEGPMLIEATRSMHRNMVAGEELVDKTYTLWATSVAIDEFVPIRYFDSVPIATNGDQPEHTDYQPEALFFKRDFIRKLGVPPASLVLATVHGDSMAPTLQPGCTIMLDTLSRHAGAGIYMVRIGREELCRRLDHRPGSILRIVSDNPDYDCYEIDSSQVSKEEFAILGRVVWVATRIR